MVTVYKCVGEGCKMYVRTFMYSTIIFAVIINFKCLCFQYILPYHINLFSRRHRCFIEEWFFFIYINKTKKCIYLTKIKVVDDALMWLWTYMLLFHKRLNTLPSTEKNKNIFERKRFRFLILFVPTPATDVQCVYIS